MQVVGRDEGGWSAVPLRLQSSCRVYMLCCSLLMNLEVQCRTRRCSHSSL